MLGQPHSSVMVLSSMQSGRAQDPVRVGQVEPSVSVMVTQVGDPEGVVVGGVVVDQPRTMVGHVARTAVR